MENKQVNSGEGHLYTLLHYAWFNLRPYDLGKIAVYCSRNTEDRSDDFKWRSVLQSKTDLEKAGVSSPKEIMKVAAIIEQWMTDLHNLTLQNFFGKILTDSGIFSSLMDTNKPSWNFQLVNTFFELIKNESTKSPLITLVDLMNILNNMKEAELTLPLMKIIHSEEGVQFLTAHSSKGLEFKHVFIIAADDKNWVTADYKNRRFRFPPSLVPATDKSDVDDDRRLFYVAMTRCESYLYLSHSTYNEEEKELEPCRFLTELMKDSDLSIQKKSLSEEAMNEFQQTLMGYQYVKAELIDHDHIDRLLQNYSMSVTHLNKYLRCPLSFYFENILKVPKARNKSMGFGNAVHNALENYFNDIQNDPQRAIPKVDVLVKYFENAMYRYRSHFTEKEYKDHKLVGKEILTGYYEQHHKNWSLPREFKQEHTVNLAKYKDIPINGKIDSIHVFDDKIEVFDYKTGKYTYAAKKLKGPQEEEDPGGDYWRQIVFYKMLLSNDPRITKPMYAGTMDFVEPNGDKYVQKRIEIEDADISLVEQQLKDSYEGIQKHEFDGCGEEECHWCDFVKQQYEMNPTLAAYGDEEDEANRYEDVGAEIIDLG